MARDEQPLLHRQDSEQSLDEAEEHALLTGKPVSRTSKDRWTLIREISLLLWAILVTAALVILAVFYQHKVNQQDKSPNPHGKRNLIFMVSDGMGPTSLSLTRSYRQFTEGLPYSSQLVLDQHHIGSSRTRSTSSLVTDSAAGATAFSCGKKSYNGAISVLDDHTPCGTVLEAAKKAGYMTGLVVTTRITDATPATFAAHVHMRSEEDSIAEQLIGHHPLGRVVDLMLGGGRCHFLPNSSEHSCRADDKDIVEKAKKKGWHYASSRKDFDALKLGEAVDLPLLGLFAHTDIPYEIDRRNEEDVYPSLDELAQTAMRALSDATKNSEKGFFLMIEGSRIDHAGHANDPAAQVHEVLAYDKAAATVLDYLRKDGTPGVMVSTSDHETGGLATARQLHEEYPDYLWYPGVLANVSHSAERLTFEYYEKIANTPKGKDLSSYIEAVVKDSLGIKDADSAEIKTLIDRPETAAYQFADMVSRRAQNGWSTHGHSAVDVNIYASSHKAASPLIGNHENTEVGEFLRDYLDLDLEPITKKLKEAVSGSFVSSSSAQSPDSEDGWTTFGPSWLGPLPNWNKPVGSPDYLQRYDGHYRH